MDEFRPWMMAGRIVISRRMLFLATVVVCPQSAQADRAKTDLHGIALGLTMEEAKHAAALPCDQPPFSSDLRCHDGTDGSDYSASFSAGTPSVALTVARSFCTDEAPESVLRAVLREFGMKQDRVVNDPNGFHIDLDPKTEAILNTDDGPCPDGRGKHHVLSLRSNALIRTESDKALDRARKALR